VDRAGDRYLHLHRQKSLYPHLYRYETPGVRGMPAGKHIGWQSDFKTKPMAVGRMTRRVESDMIDVPDQELVREMSSFRSGVNGYEEEYGGAAGRHDDLVAAFCDPVRDPLHSLGDRLGPERGNRD